MLTYLLIMIQICSHIQIGASTTKSHPVFSNYTMSIHRYCYNKILYIEDWDDKKVVCMTCKFFLPSEKFSSLHECSHIPFSFFPNSKKCKSCLGWSSVIQKTCLRIVEVFHSDSSLREESRVTNIDLVLKAHFKRRKPKKTAEQLAAQKQAMLAQIPEEQRKGISDALLSQSLDMGMVSPIILFFLFNSLSYTGGNSCNFIKSFKSR